MNRGRFAFALAFMAMILFCAPPWCNAAAPFIVYSRSFSIARSANFNPPESAAAGEDQSTVVAPHTSSACPGGRFLTTLDFNKPDTFDPSDPDPIDTDPVVYYDLDAGPGAPRPSRFTKPPAFELAHEQYGSNDHDIIALPNGDVLYIMQAFSDSGSLTSQPNPPWFNFAYRGAFGPGARTAMAIYRSKDCGANFSFVRMFDPSTLPTSASQPLYECAYPQIDAESSVDAWKILLAANQLNSRTGDIQPQPPADRPREPYYFDMGGTDGAETVADQRSGRIYLTYRCRGNIIITPPPTLEYHAAMDLSDTSVNHTIVAFSDNEGTTWSPFLWVPGNPWRFGVVPSLNAGQNNGTVAFLSGQTLILDQAKQGTRPAPLSLNLGDPAPSGESATWGQNVSPNLLGVPAISANVYSSPVIAGAGSGYVMAVPWDVPMHGYRVFYYSTVDHSVSEESPIVPSNCCAPANGFVMHVVADHVGSRTLLYWTDVDAVALTAKVVGRLVSGKNSWSNTVSLMAPSYKPWSLTQNYPPGNFFYGDYHTAGGFTVHDKTGQETYEFFPMWIEQNKRVYYSRVDYTFPPGPDTTQQRKAHVLHVTPHRGWPPPDRVYARIRGDD